MNGAPDWLSEAPLQQLFASVAAAGGTARVVGGAVRDHLLDRPVMDVDLATTLLPEAVMELATAQGWKAIPTGIAHGTVTLVLPNRVVEVTTLRRDVATDGRHATVAFTSDWQVDASRRDFTINAMSMDAAVEIHDYFDGKADIAARRVRFIGDAATRITEDALRMLRYFRFLASHGAPPADAQALAAIAQHKGLVQGLSGERIAAEMRKLLGAESPAFALRLMAETELDAEIFPHPIAPARMIRLQMLEAQAQYQTSVWARLMLLLGVSSSTDARPHPECAKRHIQTSPKGEVAPAATVTDNSHASGETKTVPALTSPLGEVEKSPSDFSGEGAIVVNWLSDRWKLSRHEQAQLKLLANLPAFAADAPRHAHTRILRLHGAPAYLDWLLLQAALTAGLDIAPHVTLAQEFKPPVFPVTAADLMAAGMQEGKALGDRLVALEQRWEQSDYTLVKEALLESPDFKG